jgi:hypothetical protein
MLLVVSDQVDATVIMSLTSLSRIAISISLGRN